MDYSSRELRISSKTRGVAIAGLMLVYAWISEEPGITWKATFLIAAGLQIAVIVIRRVVPAKALPLAIYTFEFIADGATVLMFAVGVFGSFARVSTLI